MGSSRDDVPPSSSSSMPSESGSDGIFTFAAFCSARSFTCAWCPIHHAHHHQHPRRRRGREITFDAKNNLVLQVRKADRAEGLENLGHGEGFAAALGLERDFGEGLGGEVADEDGDGLGEGQLSLLLYGPVVGLQVNYSLAAQRRGSTALLIFLRITARGTSMSHRPTCRVMSAALECGKAHAIILCCSSRAILETVIVESLITLLSLGCSVPDIAGQMCQVV